VNAVRRRDLLAAGVALLAADGALVGQQRGSMFGVITRFNAVNGRRDELIDVLLAGTVNMPGCLSYIIARDRTDENAIWVTEAWKDEASHDASLALPAVKQAVANGRPLIASIGERVVTIPVGGQGLG
jgi:quinol monooxygenase YgiN